MARVKCIGIRETLTNSLPKAEVVVDGRTRMHDGTIPGLDEKAAIAGAHQASSRILVAAGLLSEAGHSGVEA